MNNYSVYIHTNKLNNKVYVGITSKKPKYRWGHNGNSYLNKKKSGGYCQPKFANAIIKYGWDAFEHIIFAERLTKEEACRMETLLIKLWDSRENGYNNSLGGESSHAGVKMCEESRKNMGHPMTKETRAKMSIAHKGSQNHMARKVAQYDKQGNLIRIWDYITQIEEELGILKGSICTCCQHKPHHKTAGGYKWEYV